MNEELTGKVIGCAMKVHSALGHGFLESVSQSALAVELESEGIEFELEKALQVRYRGRVVGDFRADLVIEGSLIVEPKAVRALETAHEVQLVNYLNSVGLDDGLLFNFGAKSLDFRRKYRRYQPAKQENQNPVHSVNPV